MKYPEPTFFEADENGGEMRFEVTYYTSQGACVETFNYKWSFGQNMKILPGFNNKKKDYTFHDYLIRTRFQYNWPP